MTMLLQDIDKTPVTIDVPTTVTIEAVNGKVRGLNGTFKESFARTIEPGHTIPPFELLSDSLVTGEMSLIATVAPEGKTVVQSTKSMTLQPSWWLCLSAAVTGALGWAIHSFFSGDLDVRPFFAAWVQVSLPASSRSPRRKSSRSGRRSD